MTQDLSTHASAWISDIHADVDPATGYLVKQPRGVYGKKIKELVQYTCSMSTELGAIRHSRSLRTHPCVLCAAQIIYFISDTVLPVLLAVSASYAYYSSTGEETLPEQEEDVTVTVQEDNWLIEAFNMGSWIGDAVRYTVSVPLLFVAGTLDRVIHVSEAYQYLYMSSNKLFLTPLLFVCVYLSAKIMFQLLWHMYSLCASHGRLRLSEDLLIQETESAVERGITSLVRPLILHHYEELLSAPPRRRRRRNSLVETYQDHVPMLQHSVYERVAIEIQRIPFTDILKCGNVSPLYIKSIHALIRHADEELSSVMLAFHETLSKIPTDQNLYQVLRRNVLL